MCGWKKATADRRQAESRVKLAWLCRGAKEEDEVNRRHAGRHEFFPMAGAGGGRQSQPTDNKWTYWESQYERYCQIWENGLNKDVKTE